MFEYYITIAIIGLIATISPGPDFFIVAKNALSHHRNAAFMTSAGIAIGILFHTTYCVLGLAIVISQSLLLFSLIKYLGASYLIYLGLRSLLSQKNSLPVAVSAQQALSLQPSISLWQAFRDGLLTNVLNPKCTLFMLSIFTLVVKPHTAVIIQISYGVELALISILWFSFVSYGLTHQIIKRKISQAQQFINKIIGGFLILLGIFIIFEDR